MNYYIFILNLKKIKEIIGLINIIRVSWEENINIYIVFFKHKKKKRLLDSVLNLFIKHYFSCDYTNL